MTDELIRHSIFLQRYSSGILKEMSPELKALRDDVANRILTATEYEAARLSLLMADLNKIIDGHFQPLTNTIFKNVDELAAYEQQYALSLLDDATIGSVVIGAGANVSLLQAYVKNDPIRMIGEAPMTIGSMIDTFNSAYKRDINTVISTGILEGKTTKEMARAVSSLSNSRSRRQAEALVRTIVNHTGASARKRTFADHQELFVGERYVATLDSRVTIFCASNDGKIFPFDVGPFVPAHWQCRSARVPELKEEYKIIKDGTRASATGPVSEDTTYGDWLKRQPKAVQDKVLGKTRGELFRSGKLTLDKFTDKTGEIYTLKDLGVADSVMKPSLVPDIKFGYGGKFDGYVKDIRPEAKMVIDKFKKPFAIGNGNGAYNADFGQLTFPDGANTIFLHEYGHHIDYTHSKQITGDMFSPYSSSSLKNGFDLTKAYSLEIDYIGIKDKKRLYAYIDMISDIDDKYSKAGMMDILDSLSAGKVQRINGLGHGAKYYKNETKRHSENFANLFSLWSDNKHWDKTKQLFPNLTYEFEKIMQEVQDGKFD